MRLRASYELIYEFPQPTPVILNPNIHFSRVSDLEEADHILIHPSAPLSGYRDGFGNWCTRFVAPPGRTTISSDFIIRDRGEPDPVFPEAGQVEVEDLPEEALVYLLPSRFCDSDRLLDLAWTLFGQTPPGWPCVQAVCDFVHNHIAFGYLDARPTRTACEAYEEQRGVCRDFAHLGVAFCRALNIPARYYTGYISEVGRPEPHAEGDFAAWFEVYLDDGWHVFDPRNNTPRIGRVLIAQGRDAADVAMTMTFGPNMLQGFKEGLDRRGRLTGPA